MPTVKVNDIQIYYEVHGEGFPLMMIAGLAGNLDWWDPRLIQALSSRFKLVIFDNRGAGRTDISDKQYTVKLFADDVEGLMDALGIPKANILGISLGGMIAQELVLNYPEKVEKLILCSTYCGGSNSVQPSPETLGMLAVDRSTLSSEEIVRAAIPLIFAEDFIGKNSDLVEFAVQAMLRAPISSEAFARQLNAIIEFDTYDRLPQIKAPTLVLHGKRDILIPPENASILAKAIPNAKLVYFENSAHGLVEEMEKLIGVLMSFIAES